jgi:carbon storage regulator CsrA
MAVLILSRTTNQDILIADGMIKIRVTKIRDNRVWLGIEAPTDIPITRPDAVCRTPKFKEMHDGNDG